MTKHGAKEQSPVERRRFERVDIHRNSQVVVLEGKNKQVGVLRQIGRGGFMMEPEKSFTKDDKPHKLTIHEPDEEISVEVKARVLYTDGGYVGFEFVDLDPEAAVELGIIIGKFYEANHER